MNVVLIASLVGLGMAFAISLVRVARGPTAADRGTAADVGYLVAVAAFAIVAVLIDASVFIDLVLVATVVGFLATIAFAWLVDRGGS